MRKLIFTQVQISVRFEVSYVPRTGANRIEKMSLPLEDSMHLAWNRGERNCPLEFSEFKKRGLKYVIMVR